MVVKCPMCRTGWDTDTLWPHTEAACANELYRQLQRERERCRIIALDKCGLQCGNCTACDIAKEIAG